MKTVRGFTLTAVEVLTTLALIVVLWFYTEANATYAIPAMSDALEEFQNAWLFERFTSDVVPTLIRLAAGYGIAVLVAVPLGLALGSFKAFRLFMQPLTAMLRSIPAVALIPPLVIILGIGNAMMLFLVVIVCIWPIALNTCDGVLQINDTVRSTAKVFGLSRLETLRFVLLPDVSPRILAGMRTSLALALILVIASEYMVGTDGVGSYVSRAQQTYDIASMWAGIILLGIIGYLLNLVFLVAQQRVLRWQRAAPSRQ